MRTKLRSKKSAVRFGEAYPMGNGSIGAMDYGQFPTNRIALSHNTFFSGNKNSGGAPIGAPHAFLKMRELAEAGKLREAQNAAEQFIPERGNYGTNLPVGDLKLSFPAFEGQEYILNRELDIENGISLTEVSCNGISIGIKTLVSHPDKMLAVIIQSDEPVSMEAAFIPYSGIANFKAEELGITFITRAIETLHCDDECGVNLAGEILPTSNGRVELYEEKAELSNFTKAAIYLTMETDYLDQLEGVVEDNARECLFNRIRSEEVRVKALNYDSIIFHHKQDMKQLYMKAQVYLADDNSEIDEKAEFLFAYGRYLFYCSSREDSILPAHLQGIWNDAVACTIGWTCDMHLDVNTQMNYWIADKTGLGEQVKPLTAFVENLASAGRKSARDFYGLPGWSAELVTNAWHFTSPYWATPIAPSPTCGIWILGNLWDHYKKSDDIEYLRTHLYPLLKTSVNFFTEYLYIGDDGYLTCGPSISPENSFLIDGEKTELSSGCTFDIIMIRELFCMYLEAEEILNIIGIHSEKVKEQLRHLRSYRIKYDGTLAEWSSDYIEMDTQHRHTSHLLGLYPFHQIERGVNDELCEAAAKSIEQKITPEEGYESTGWARSMLLLYESRLHNGEKAYQHLNYMIKELQEPNGLIYHPPTRGADAFDHVYELDGNTGIAAGISEMLLQSHDKCIYLLPAIPKKWSSGEFHNLIADGAIDVSCYWSLGEVTSFTLKSPKDVQVEVIMPEGFSKTCDLKKNTEYNWTR